MIAVAEEMPLMDVVDPSQLIQELISKGDYEQTIAYCQHEIESDPTAKRFHWYLGLALLLQGEETDAQTVWMLGMMDGNEAEVAGWTADLVAILQTEADRQITVAQAEPAWLIRQYIRELWPTDLPNLLQLIALATQLNRFHANDLQDWGVLDLLQSAEAIAPIGLQPALQGLLTVAPEADEVMQFAEISLSKVVDPVAIVTVLMDRAIDLAYGGGRPDIAARYTQMCLNRYPGNLDFLSHLSHFYQSAGDHAEAIETARTACMTARDLPDQVFAAFLLIRSMARAGGYWADIFPIFEHQEQLVQQMADQYQQPFSQDVVLRLSTSTFFQPYLRDDLARNRQVQNTVLRLCQDSIQTYAQERADRYRAELAQRRQTREPQKKLRIGYVSHCLKRHSVGWLCRWLFQYHDRTQYEIYGFFWNYQPGVQDELQEWFIQHVDQARFLGRDSGEIADQILADEIDILIDLDSITADIISEVMALKPAPVQVTWLGWDASGIPAVDYYMADPYVLPAHAEQHYAEKIWRLPQTYIAVDGFEVEVPTLRRRELDIPPEAIVYWSGQSSYKRHPDTVRSQMRIVQAVPNSYFLVKGLTGDQALQEYFLAMAQTEGVRPEQVRFIPDVHREAVHRANLAIADVVLDTYPYNGATTTLETLWMGIPMVTRVGDHFSSRNSYTMMKNVGLEEGIAWSDEEYVDWGIRLGLNPDLRQQIAWKLWRSRQTAPLWDSATFTRQMEAAYEQMWAVYEGV